MGLLAKTRKRTHCSGGKAKSQEGGDGVKELTRVFEGRNVRVFVDDAGEPWFVASDVCACLGYANPRDAIAKHVAWGDVAKRDAPSSSGVQSFNVINQSGLYSLALGSKLPGAQKFKHWITSEVLPSIQKTGGYGRYSPLATDLTAREVNAQRTEAQS